MSAGAEAKFGPESTVVVFGLDEAGKPHASVFGAADAQVAEKAAGLMGMRVLRLKTDQQRAIAAKLPRGRVFGSGKALVPFVAKRLYESLAGFGGAEVGAQPGGPEPACAAAPGQDSGMPRGDGDSKLPASVDDLEAGHVVLACEGPALGWYEAIVIKVDDDDLVTLKWRDFPRHPVFARRRWQLALLPDVPAVA